MSATMRTASDLGILSLFSSISALRHFCSGGFPSASVPSGNSELKGGASLYKVEEYGPSITTNSPLIMDLPS